MTERQNTSGYVENKDCDLKEILTRMSFGIIDWEEGERIILGRFKYLDKLRLERDEARLERDLAKMKLDHVQQIVNHVFPKFVGFLDELSQPHYLTHQEKQVLENKGAEALFIHWHQELKRVDEEGKKKYDMPLPKRHKPWRFLTKSNPKNS